MSRPDVPKKTFCTTREAAELLGVSLRTVQLWSEAEVLEAWKTTGGHRRITRSSVERLLAGQPPVVESANAIDSALRVLLVEDDPQVLRLYERQMARWPMQPLVATAENGFEALIRIGLRKPDLLITDLSMPEMDGFRMLRHLRAMPELAKVTIVVVSGLDPAEIEAHGGVPEGIPILPKPVPFDRLRDIATVLASRNGRQAQRKT